jgi:hypothetical protein
MDMDDSEYIRMRVDQILIQTTKTNGRVDRLEGDMGHVNDKVEGLIASNNMNKGRDKALWYFIIALATIAGFFISHFIEKL